jgi:hypothetical protein
VLRRRREAALGRADVSTRQALPGRERTSVVEGKPRLRWTTIAPRASVVPALVGLAVVAGCVFRLAQYFANRSLWLDESQLALNILDRSANGVTGVLDFNQAAPTAFLLIEGLVTDVAGASEYALRLFPLLCGIASVFFFAELCRTLLAAPARLLAITLFASAAGLIYYASEVKQYSTDVAATLALYLLTRMLVRRGVTVRKVAAASVAGAALIAVSHASVLVVAGIFCVLAGRAVAVRGIEGWRPAVATVPWLVCAGAGVIATLYQGAHVAASLAGSFGGAPGPSSGPLYSLRRLLSALTRSVGYPDTAPSVLHWSIVALACVGLGSLALRRRLDAALLLAPFGALLVASSLHEYPILDRTVLFLVPAMVIFLAQGATAIADRFPQSRLTWLFVIGLSALVLALPLTYASKHLLYPRKHEEVKAVLEHIRAHWRPGDTLYIHYGSQYAFRYYLECDCFGPVEELRSSSSWRLTRTEGKDQFAPALRSSSPGLVIGRFTDDDSRLLEQVESLRGRSRVWILYTHTMNSAQAAFLRTQMVADLDRIGHKLDSFGTTGAHTYLYDLKATKRR